MYRACLLLSTILAVSGCSIKQTTSGEPLTRMLVGQTGATSILVIDLDSTPDIRTVDVPLTSSLPDFTSLQVDQHPWGGMGFVTQRGANTYWMNLNSGAEITAASGVVSGMHLIKPLRNGVYLVAAKKGYPGVHSFSTIPAAAVNSVDLSGRDIDDIAVCDDNRTVLISNNRPLSSRGPRRQYITHLTIAENGQLSASGHELELMPYLSQIECAAGSSSGVALAVGGPGDLISFTIGASGAIALVDTQTAAINPPADASAPILQSIKFSPDGASLFARLSTGGTYAPKGWLEKYTFNTTSGDIAPIDTWQATAPHTTNQGEAVRLTMAPDGGRIYVPDEANSQILAISTVDGSVVQTITGAEITAPRYISAGTVTCFDPDHSGCE